MEGGREGGREGRISEWLVHRLRGSVVRHDADDTLCLNTAHGNAFDTGATRCYSRRIRPRGHPARQKHTAVVGQPRRRPSEVAKVKPSQPLRSQRVGGLVPHSSSVRAC